jgi:hypothetical protein
MLAASDDTPRWANGVTALLNCMTVLCGPSTLTMVMSAAETEKLFKTIASEPGDLTFANSNRFCC